VRFEIDGPLMRSSHCHCRQCQKAHGAPFRTRARVAAADFRFLAGEELVSFYESTPGTHRGFCKVCGAPVLVKFGEHSADPRTRTGIWNHASVAVETRASGGALPHARGEGRLPLATIEEASRSHCLRIEIVETAGVDAVLVGIGTRHVKGVDAAGSAEGVLRRAGIEPVSRHLSLAAQQFEIPGCDGVRIEQLHSPIAVGSRSARMRNRTRPQ
jgi:hypothetical protein